VTAALDAGAGGRSQSPNAIAGSVTTGAIPMATKCNVVTPRCLPPRSKQMVDGAVSEQFCNAVQPRTRDFCMSVAAA
jgi:hypothetical protein